MFCSECGNKLEENARFCSQCGNKVFDLERIEIADESEKKETVQESETNISRAEEEEIGDDNRAAYSGISLEDTICEIKTGGMHMILSLICSAVVILMSFGKWLQLSFISVRNLSVFKTVSYINTLMTKYGINSDDVSTLQAIMILVCCAVIVIVIINLNFVRLLLFDRKPLNVKVDQCCDIMLWSFILVSSIILIKIILFANNPGMEEFVSFNWQPYVILMISGACRWFILTNWKYELNLKCNRER